MRVGLNVAFDSQMPDYGGSSLVRMPLWRGFEAPTLARYNALVTLGITPILCLDRRSYTPYGWQRQRPLPSMRLWAKLFKDATDLVIECGNEPEGLGPSSSTQSRANFYAFLRAARQVWPDATIISGSLVGIDFSYLDGLDDLPIQAAGVHLYAQDADSVKPLIAEIRRHTSLPLWCTEFGAEAGATPEAEHERAVWLSGMLVSLWEENIEAACVYCGKRDQGEFGLINVDDTPTESWAAFAGAVPNLAGPPPDPTPEPDQVPWTAEQVRLAAQIPVAHAADVAANWPLIYQAAVQYGCASPMSLVALIGTIATESASTFCPVEEAYWLSDTAKAKWYRDHGYGNYWGRGFIQTTWESNYQKVQDMTDLPVIDEPELLLQAGPAALAACVYWTTHAYGPPQVLAEAGNWAEVRKSVYGAFDPNGTARIQAVADALL